MKQMIRVLVILILMLTLTACSEDDIVDQATNIIQSTDENILSVKNAVPSNYSGTTYGEAFDSFFASPAWKYFVGTKSGTDEDGDGIADTTEEQVDIVEFTGYCTYKEVEVKALIQFTLDKEAGMFEATYLSFNEVPQNKLTLLGVLDTVFSNAVENSDVATNDDISGTGQAFIGQWSDVNTLSCEMTIDCSDGVTYYIDINWGFSGTEAMHWKLIGSYDEETGSIYYSGSCFYEEYYEDGSVYEEWINDDASGTIFIGDDGMLYWEDHVENAGSSFAFQKR